MIEGLAADADTIALEGYNQPTGLGPIAVVVIAVSSMKSSLSHNERCRGRLADH
jgi:hypothetical protein